MQNNSFSKQTDLRLWETMQLVLVCLNQLKYVLDNLLSEKNQHLHTHYIDIPPC